MGGSRPSGAGAPREFHVGREARDRYRFEEAIFTAVGNVVFGDFGAARRFAEKINAQRDLAREPERAVRPGEIAALGLIDEIQHQLFRAFRQRVNPRLLSDLLAGLGARLGGETVAEVLARFGDHFPPLAVYRGDESLERWLGAATDGEAHAELALEELLMLWIANGNSAYSPYRELFDDGRLSRESPYPRLLPALEELLALQPRPEGLVPGEAPESILELLRAPARAEPHSVEAQLRWVLERWGGVLGREFVDRVLTSIDVLKEEGRLFLVRDGDAGFGLGGAPHGLTGAEVPVADFHAAEFEAEPERFTPDRAWMPRLVLLAKNAFVWLDQLSKSYGREIRHLDEVPDAELDRLAAQGMTGLWLIGLWERSAASRYIKRRMGNPEAVASAYSLYDYQIAADLGGEAALAELKRRAAERGIRLASDMVPNHVGIDGRWVIERPDWFIQSDRPPFPVYRFSGPDLSPDERVELRIEDGYWSRRDAAVVFERIDRQSRERRYLYHGNDGTNMPWNDTAQLDYLKPEVREAVIQVILRVARDFPIIRFDAAMTLAKRHYQRLWYPEPGRGGDIPSRAERGLTKAQFDERMPEEFWREVVDRCAVEAPDTLLLAEAFWLMEGYFVRTLGMHRVYNSAFMVCLRDEENGKYRQILKNVLEFDPEVLYRFVNFMNNPDERTAVDQFGKGDKYFGIATLMATLPGLPMFGHGQVEGFEERYGMEYRRAYYDERPDAWLVARHEREIFPLLKRRALFSGVDDFLLYDLRAPDGHVVEDVFAYSNRRGAERALVVYHNRHGITHGFVRDSVGFAEKGTHGEKGLVRRSIAEGLALRAGEADYLVFREQASGLEYLRRSAEVAARGLYVELGPYQCRVLLDFREVADREGARYADLARELGERGVASVDEALRELHLQPLHRPLAALLAEPLLRSVFDALADLVAGEVAARGREAGAFEGAGEAALDEEAQSVEVAALSPGDEPPPEAEEAALGGAAAAAPIAERSELATRLRAFLAVAAETASAGAREAAATERATLSDLALFAAHLAAGSLESAPRTWLERGTERPLAVAAWLLLRRLERLTPEPEPPVAAAERYDDWRLGKVVRAALAGAALDPAAVERGERAVRLLLALPQAAARLADSPLAPLVERLLADPAVQRFAGVNRYEGTLWFNRESFDELAGWLLFAAGLDLGAGDELTEADLAGAWQRAQAAVARLREAATASGYRVATLLDQLAEPPRSATETPPRAGDGAGLVAAAARPAPPLGPPG